MLDVRELSYKIDGKLILNNVSMYANKGELIGLIGKNGAGKTTFLECITGLRKKSKGSISINAVDSYERSKYILSFIGDSPYLYDYLTGAEFLELYADLYGTRFSHQKIIELVKFLEMDNKMEALIKTYSKGMRMKIILIGSILLNPDLLVLDEPFNGLDPTSLIRVSHKLQELCNNGVTVILSSHSLESVRNLCSRIYHLDNKEMKEVNRKSLEELFQ